MDRITATKTARLADDCHKIFSLTNEVKGAISKTNREEFVPAGFRHNAYKLDALPLSSAQWISSPLTVAKMTHYLEHQGADRVLEVGCGSGYQAAVLSHLFRGVFTIERIESLMIQAKNKFKKLGINNIHTRTDDGQNGWIQYAPYDRILFSATAKEIPQKLFEQLSDGGILVAPMQKGSKQIITRFRKSGDSLIEEELEECDFVPVLDGIQKVKQAKLFLLTLLFVVALEASQSFAEANILYKAGNYKESFKIFQELAKDDPDAAYMLAYMYEHGEGCEIDEEKASQWYKVSSQGYYKQVIHSSRREVEKTQTKLFSSLDKLLNSETEDTMSQYAKSLYNIKAHNANYFLPVSYRYDSNYANTNGHEAKRTETEFQFSVKFDIVADILGFDEIYSVAYTQKSFWQFYSDSAFFRESNYNPEFFVVFPTSELNDGRLIKAFRLGIAHESNGRGGVEERSWNYLSGSLYFQYKMLFTELKVWARLPDNRDYNSDLIDYMGHGHVKFMLPYKKHFLDMKLRYNFSNKGSAEANYSYPLFGRDDLFLYMKLFNGYGESLIDYDNHIKKFGIGFSISR